MDVLENNILDGTSFDEITQNDNLKVVLIKNVNAKKEDGNKNKISNLSDDLFNKFFNLNIPNSPEIININNKYYIAEISSIDKKNKLYGDRDVQEALNAQLNFKNKIENNASIIKDISMGGFDIKKLKEFSSNNELEIKNYEINNLKQNEIFSEGIIKRIFLIKDGKVDLITNSTLTKSYLVLSLKTDFKNLVKEGNEYEKYEAKARLNLINKIYQSHDNNLNEKYKVELNQRTIERVKNSF